jgi:hypothetical protein
MAFRDDRDALRAQREALEAEVRDLRVRTRAAEEQVARHEVKGRTDREHIAELGAEVNRLRMQLGLAPRVLPLRRRRRMLLGVMVAFALAGGLVGVLYSVRETRSAHVAPPPVVAPPPAPSAATAPLPREVNELVLREQPELRRCYETAIRGQSEVEPVRIEVQASFAASGELSSITVRGPDGSPDGLLDCVRSRVRGWRVEPREPPVNVRVPIVFSPG